MTQRIQVSQRARRISTRARIATVKIDPVARSRPELQFQGLGIGKQVLMEEV